LIAVATDRGEIRLRARSARRGRPDQQEFCIDKRVSGAAQPHLRDRMRARKYHRGAPQKLTKIKIRG